MILPTFQVSVHIDNFIMSNKGVHWKASKLDQGTRQILIKIQFLEFKSTKSFKKRNKNYKPFDCSFSAGDEERLS